MASKRIRAIVHGRVQGVFFRSHTEEEARKLELAGWVRNRPDGTVEVVAQGEPEQVDRLLGWLRQGPSAARVDELTVTAAEPGREPQPFTIRYD